MPDADRHEHAAALRRARLVGRSTFAGVCLAVLGVLAGLRFELFRVPQGTVVVVLVAAAGLFAAGYWSFRHHERVAGEHQAVLRAYPGPHDKRAVDEHLAEVRRLRRPSQLWAVAGAAPATAAVVVWTSVPDLPLPVLVAVAVGGVAGAGGCLFRAIACNLQIRRHVLALEELGVVVENPYPGTGVH